MLRGLLPVSLPITVSGIEKCFVGTCCAVSEIRQFVVSNGSGVGKGRKICCRCFIFFKKKLLGKQDEAHKLDRLFLPRRRRRSMEKFGKTSKGKKSRTHKKMLGEGVSLSLLYFKVFLGTRRDGGAERKKTRRYCLRVPRKKFG